MTDVTVVIFVFVLICKLWLCDNCKKELIKCTKTVGGFEVTFGVKFGRTGSFQTQARILILSLSLYNFEC